MGMEKTDQDNPSAESTSEQAGTQIGEGKDEKATLLARLQEKEVEAKTNYELFLRERADVENFKRRMQREQTEAVRFANEPLIRDLLPVVDNLERAVGHAQGGGNGQSLVEGVALVVRSFLDTLEKYGVTRVTAKGEPFDPARHEAMAQVERADVAANTVVDEHCPAYLLHGRLIRPALVTVAKTPSDEKKSEE
jgi:molecular chaperone GrpE